MNLKKGDVASFAAAPAGWQVVVLEEFPRHEPRLSVVPLIGWAIAVSELGEHALRPVWWEVGAGIKGVYDMEQFLAVDVLAPGQEPEDLEDYK